MNFLKILQNSGKNNLRDIASEVAAVEKEIPKFKEKVNKAENKVVELRKIRLGGGQVSDKDLELANQSYEESKQNLQALESALTDLRAELERAAQAKLDIDKELLESDPSKLREEERDLDQRIMKVAAQLKALFVERDGGSDHLRAPYGFNLDLSKMRDYKIFKDELNRFLENQKKPTLYDKKRKLEAERSKIRSQSVESIIKEALEEAAATDKQ